MSTSLGPSLLDISGQSEREDMKESKGPILLYLQVMLEWRPTYYTHGEIVCNPNPGYSHLGVCPWNLDGR